MIAALAALLDRSVARIAEVSADGRYFDREQVATIADIWDNNSVPLLGALAGRTRRERERRAGDALRWMADLGPDRRAWMIEQAAVAGYRLEPFLGPAPPEPAHYPDHAGRVQPVAMPLTGLEADYDLGAGVLRSVAVERAGPALGGHVALVVPRRYPGATDDREAALHLRFRDVRTVRFDSDDTAGVVLTAGGTELRWGDRGLISAMSATLDVEDPWWHLSQAGRAADARTPTVRPPRHEHPSAPVPGAAGTAALVLQQAMIEIRTVRFAANAGRVPLGELCAAFTGAGDRLLTAAGRPWWARDRAFRQVTDQWIGASPRLAARLHRNHLSGGPGPKPSPHAVTGPPPSAQLTMARYTVPDTGRDPGSAMILAVPDGGGTWGLRSEAFRRPSRMALDTSAFTTPHPFTHPPGGPVRLGDDALVVTEPATDGPAATSSGA